MPEQIEEIGWPLLILIRRGKSGLHGKTAPDNVRILRSPGEAVMESAEEKETTVFINGKGEKVR